MNEVSEVAPARPPRDPAGALDDDAATERLARWTFVGLGIVALVFFLVVGRRAWFSFDEWEFLAGRSLSLHDLLEQHGGQLVALPLVVYRTLFAIFGLRSYLPYQAVVVVLHITTAWLLRVVMRRAGVRPWIATAAASLFLFFGSGGQNILWGFQITFVGSIAFGLAQLLLADHDGGLDRRDWLALAMGFGAITCSGVGLIMVGVAGVAALVRRGWRAAAFHAVPLPAIYVLWKHQHPSNSPTTTNVTLLFRWARRCLAASFNAMGQLPLVGWALAAVLVVGLAFAWRSLPRNQRRRGAAIPVALLVGVAGFLIATANSRAPFGLATANFSRYLYVVAALLIVPLAVAADALARGKRTLGLVMVVLLLVGVPGNLSKTRSSFAPASGSTRFREMILSVARSPLARRVPRSLRPDPNAAPQVTIGWLLDGVRSGRLPRPKPLAPRAEATNALRLGLEELDSGDDRSCPTLPGPTNRTLRAGQSLVVRGTVAVQLLPDARLPLSDVVLFGTTFHAPRGSHTLLAVAGPVSLRIAPRSARASAC